MKIEFNAKETTQALMGVLDYHKLMEPIIKTVTGSSDPIGREVVEKRIEKAMEYRLPVYFTIKYLLILNKNNLAPFPIKFVSTIDIMGSVVSQDIPCMETHIYKIFQDFLTENQIPEYVINHRIQAQLPRELSNRVTFPQIYMVMTAASVDLLEKYALTEKIDDLMGANPRFIEYIWTQVVDKLISGTFTWEGTPEGIDYWVDINSKWKVYFWKHLM